MICATDISFCHPSRMATGAFRWQSLCSENQGAKLFWFGRQHSTAEVELEAVKRAVQSFSPYTQVDFITDQVCLTNHTKHQVEFYRVKARTRKLCRIHQLIIEIFDIIEAKFLSVEFIRAMTSPLYIACHDMAKQHLRRFCPVPGSKKSKK